MNDPNWPLVDVPSSSDIFKSFVYKDFIVGVGFKLRSKRDWIKILITIGLVTGSLTC